MNKQIYLGEYLASSTCIKRFMTTESETNDFPSSVSRECDMCNTTHRFNLSRTHLISTKSRLKVIEEYCKNSNVEYNVEVH